jgi:hypothetical protein
VILHRQASTIREKHELRMGWRNGDDERSHPYRADNSSASPKSSHDA